MNKLNSKLLGTALLFAAVVVPQAANANPTCTLGVKPGLVITSTILQSEPTAQAIGHALYIDSSYQGVRDANCSEQDVVNAIVVHNGPGPYDAVQPIRVPVVTGVTTTTTTTTTATQSSAPVVQATPVVMAPPPIVAAPVVIDNTPEIRQAQARLTQMEREHAALQRALAQKPKAVWSPGEINRVNGLASAIAKAEKDIAALKAAVALKADKSYVDAQLAGKANLTDVYTKSEVDTKLASQPVTTNGWTWWDMLFRALVLLGLLALGGWVFTKASKKEVKDIDTSLQQLADITLPGDLERQLVELSVGETADIRVACNGENGVISFTKVNQTQVQTNQIDGQSQPMNIARLASTLKRHLGRGRVHFNAVG